MNQDKFITICCVCGREKTERGWQYSFLANDRKNMYSHGFCSDCYNTEIMKAKVRQALSALALLR